VLFQLFGAEHVPPIGHVLFAFAARLVEGVHHQGALHLDGLVLLVGKEHQPTAEAARGDGAGARHHRIGPYGDDAHRLLAVLGCVGPGNALAQIQLGATGRDPQQCQDGRSAAAGRNDVRHP
jgi:hypothetical protein